MGVTHRVQQGECMSSIAAQYGFAGWQALYNHPDNADLKKARPSPNILLPGDKVCIPDREDKQEECATEAMHRFIKKMPRTSLRVVLQDPEGRPFAGKKYIVKIGLTHIEGTTAEDGLVEVKVPLTERTAILSAWVYDDESENPDLEYELLIGHMDPITAVLGIQTRLQNLGFQCPVDGVLGDETAAAIRSFRDKYDVTPEGEDLIDDTLRNALVANHEGA